MKKILNVILAVLIFTFLSTVSFGQSEMVYDSGTDITVTTGADICADDVTINGTYSGDGTKCNAALPVELVYFTADVEGNVILLEWLTATEVNNYGFEVERQYQVSSIEYQDSSEWDKIGFVQGNGTTNSPKQYSFTDPLNLTLNPNLDRIDYRLKQIDNDGTFAYSKIVTVDLSYITLVEDELNYKFVLEQNYPNPFNPTTKIIFTIGTPPVSFPFAKERTEEGFVTLRVYDVLGREVATLVNQKMQPGNYEVNFDAGNLSSGIYFYKLTYDKFNSIKKFNLIK